MAKPAGKVVSLAELRFKPANSNHAARAVFSHHFVNVPACSFARDDGISHYLGSETGMETFPASPDTGAPQDVDVPPIQGETPVLPSLHRRLMRGGFALSVFLHAAAAVVVAYATLTLPDDAALEEGMLSVTLTVEGNDVADARTAGTEEEVTGTTSDTPPKTAPKEIEKPVTATTERVLKDVPLPTLGADLPEILAAEKNETKIEAVAKSPVDTKIEPVVAEKPVEQKMVEKQSEEKPKPVEEKPEAEKKEPKKRLERERKPEEKTHGNRGDQQANANKGDVDSRDRSKASTSSRGNSSNPEIGNAARTNYKGLVNRKLSRAKGRIPPPAKGKVTVTFIIMAYGSISGLAVTQSSGKPAVDAAALKVVRSAAPFPPIPAEAGRKSWKMTVPMTFKGGN